MSTRIDLDSLLYHESEQVEWKEGVADPDQAARTLVAFANDFSNLGGGYLVAGIREVRDAHDFPRAERVGLAAAEIKAIRGRILTALTDRAAPALVPEVEELDGPTPDRRILVFFMPASSLVHTFRVRSGETGYPIRVGSETRDARNGLYAALMSRKSTLPPWDHRPAAGARLEDIDLVALRDGLQRLKLWDDRPIETWLDPRTPLSPLVPPLVVKDAAGVPRPAHFALLLFGRQPTLHCPGAWTYLSVYPGTDRATDSTVLHDITGPLPQQVERTLALLKDQAPLLVDKRVTEGQNLPRYPERALQEAAVNAIVHRDYTSPEPTRITVFADRIEFSSPGGLPFGVEPAAFLAGQAPPIWRNRALAWFFRELGLAQTQGQGLQTIRAALAAVGSPAPSFLAEPARVVCVLPAHPRSRTQLDIGRVRRLLDADAEAAWTAAQALWQQDPRHPVTQELLVEAAARVGRLPEALRSLSDHGISMDALGTEARVTLIEVELSDAAPGAPLSPLAEVLIEALPRTELSPSLVRRLIRAFIPALRYDALEALLERYTASSTTAKHDLPFLKPVADAMLAEVRRVAAREAEPGVSTLVRNRLRERLDTLIPAAQLANRLAEEANFRTRGGLKAVLETDWQWLEALRSTAGLVG